MYFDVCLFVCLQVLQRKFQSIKIHTLEGRKEGRFGVLHRFQKLRSYPYEIESLNREEIPSSFQAVPRGLSIAEGLQTVLYIAAHLDSD